jgi:hypothetical protein
MTPHPTVRVLDRNDSHRFWLSLQLYAVATGCLLEIPHRKLQTIPANNQITTGWLSLHSFQPQETHFTWRPKTAIDLLPTAHRRELTAHSIRKY